MGAVGGKACEPSQPSAASLVDCELCTEEARERERRGVSSSRRRLSVSSPVARLRPLKDEEWPRRLLSHCRLPTHLEGTVEVPGELHQLLLHRLADGAAVAVQSHAVHQQEAEEKETRKCELQ